jgi:hypothetical protein
VAGWLVKSDFKVLFGHPLGDSFLWPEGGKTQKMAEISKLNDRK